MKLGIIFGGTSTEHDVSVVSGTSVIKNLNKEKYSIFPIYIDEKGNWNKILDNVNDIEIYKIGTKPKNYEKIEDVFKYLKEMDVIFPVMHGLYGEDGTIQGLCKMLNIPCVGCGVLTSSVCMDKFYTKIILKNAGINVSPDIYIKYENSQYKYVENDYIEKVVTPEEISSIIEDKFGYPVFVKPSNSGSSVGVTKATDLASLIDSLEEAAKYDRKILIEQEILGREVECAILNKEASTVGEVLSAENFYTFDAKYKNSASKTVIPAEIDTLIIEEIKNIAKRAFNAVDGNGLSRIDFFVEKDTNKIYLNEINTMPGFTEISMYPKLVEHLGLSYTDLLDKLIELAK